MYFGFCNAYDEYIGSVHINIYIFIHQMMVASKKEIQNSKIYNNQKRKQKICINTHLGQFNFLLFVQMFLAFYTMYISRPASYSVSRRSPCCLSLFVRCIINDEHLIKLRHRPLAPHSRFLQSYFRYQNENEH